METNEIKTAAVQADDNDKKSAGIFTYKFANPFTYEGKTYEELTFDFGKLSGRDSKIIENELRAVGHVVLVASLDSEYLSRACARACTVKIGWDTLEAMPIRDYNAICKAARNFLT